MSRRAVLGAALVLLAPGLAGAHPGLHHDIARVSETIEKEPANANAYLERAFLERLDEQFEQALQDLDKAAQLQPANLAVAAERGMTLSALGRDFEADRQLSRFLARGAGTAPVYAERAKVRQRLGRPADAIADYGAALALRPDIDWYVARGLLQESLGQLGTAAAGYQEGVARVGDAVVLDLALLRVEAARGRYDAARAVVDRQLARAPVKTEWYLRRADLEEARGDAQEAREDRQRALTEADLAVEQNATAMRLLSRARAQAALGRIEDARQDLRLALEKSPRFTEARELLDTLVAAVDDKGMKP